MKHKWLEEIGVKSYSDNWWEERNKFRLVKNKLKDNRKKKEFGVAPSECYDLNTTFYEWLYEHLCQYVHDSKDIVDLNYHKFTFEDIEYTQLELIDLLKETLIKLMLFDDFKGAPLLDHEIIYNKDTCSFITKSDEELKREFRNTVEQNMKEFDALRKKALDIWYIILPSMWW